MHSTHNTLARWQRQVLAATAVLLTCTGALWLVLHYLVGGPMEGLPHPAEGWTMRLHGAGVFLGLFMLGALAAHHIPKGRRMTDGRRGRHWRRQYRSGLALCMLAALLVASGYALYYIASESTRPALGGVHAAAGFAMTALGLWHRARKRLTAPGAHRASSAP